jgi:hypothetical protein
MRKCPFKIGDVVIWWYIARQCWELHVIEQTDIDHYNSVQDSWKMSLASKLARRVFKP